MSAIRTYNVEAGLSTLDEARRLVIEKIKRAKREGSQVLKVIHGYGSSGKGGALYVGLRKSFGLRKKEAVIKDFIAGEDFSIFNETVLALLEAVPELRGDPDLGATERGGHHPLAEAGPGGSRMNRRTLQGVQIASLAGGSQPLTGDDRNPLPLEGCEPGFF